MPKWTLAALTAVAGVAAAPSGVDTAFIRESRAAMDRMMSGMDVRASGDADHDFAAMMIPHHQAAIDMAASELRYGHDERLRRIAQEIIVDQQQEIVVMRGLLAQGDGAAAPAPKSMTMNDGRMMP